MLWLLLVILFLLLCYHFLIKPQLYWKHRNVKQGFPIPIFGDNIKMVFKKEAMIETVRRIYKRYSNERYGAWYQGTMPTLMLCDPDLIKQIAVKDFDHFVDHRGGVDHADPIWKRNLFSLSGDEWREMRATLSPTFTASKMRAMFVLMEKSAQQYVDFYWQKNKESMDLEMKDSITRFANDVIASCAFGIDVDSLKNPDNEFYANGKIVTSISGFRMLFVTMVPKIAKLLGITLFPHEASEFFRNIVKDTVRIRDEQKIIRPDMINLLMEARNGRLKYDEPTGQKEAGFASAEEHIGTSSQKGIKLTDNDMAAQVLIFFFAGFDTISTMMSFMCYELALHPEAQERLRQEVDDTLNEHNGKLTYDALNKMKYLDMVVSESMRKHSAGGAIDRMCTKAYTIQPERPGEVPVHLKPGDVVWIPLPGLHHDERYFENPTKFDPERFSDENKPKIKPYTFLPFGVGPRNCITSRFALMEVKTLIFHILAKFELNVIEKTVIPLKYSRSHFNPAIEGGCWVGLKRRQNPVLK